MSRLVRLDCHDAEGAAKRYQRALQMVGDVQIVNWAGLRSQRWVAFVNNGYTSAVVLSHGKQAGLCTCEDFKKNSKSCKHIYAAVLAINRAEEGWKDGKYDEDRKEALQAIKRELAVKAAYENRRLIEMKERLERQIEQTMFIESKIERVAELEEAKLL